MGRTRRCGDQPLMLAVLAAAACMSPAASRAHAQGGANAAPVLELPASARARALGGAYVAASGDDASLFFSPAQLGTVARQAVAATEQRYVEGSTLFALSGAVRVGRSSVALGVQALDFGSVVEIIASPGGGP
jgi:hypothetical protein